MKNYEEKFSEDGEPVRVFKTTEEAWKAYETMKHDGWGICCFGGFENALIKRS